LQALGRIQAGRNSFSPVVSDEQDIADIAAAAVSAGVSAR
jgi:hypothetical protein